tara:strand:- start:45 stop:749 length:705 start_codon:yes stop_codon:yes gene_type:complete
MCDYGLSNKKQIKKKTIRIRLRKKIEKTEPEYWLPEELFSIVKEYAGVYNITTKWNKIMSVGVDRIHNFYKENFNRRITNAKTNPNKVKKMILKHIIKMGMNEDKYKLLAELVDSKRKVTKNTTDFTIYKVGEEVKYFHVYGAGCVRYYAGIITKVNKASITFKPYKISHKVSDNPNAGYWQSIESVKHYYDKNNFDKPKNVRTCFKTKYTDTLSRYADPEDFDYYETRHDYGN